TPAVAFRWKSRHFDFFSGLLVVRWALRPLRCAERGAAGRLPQRPAREPAAGAEIRFGVKAPWMVFV
ncbi:MAG TPA: hypothetical protein PLF37_14980, partial [Planctomycetota bacterium]|nr:hypothetical protein [Planctomycetota bacterium]